MKKRRIVLASVLKPVDETRMFEKLAITLSQKVEYEIHIAGYPGTVANLPQNISLHALPTFSRLSISRLLAPWRVFKITYEVKPELLIVNTHELLIVALLNRIL